jgi:hypothetical protein
MLHEKSCFATLATFGLLWPKPGKGPAGAGREADSPPSLTCFEKLFDNIHKMVNFWLTLRNRKWTASD